MTQSAPPVYLHDLTIQELRDLVRSLTCDVPERAANKFAPEGDRWMERNWLGRCIDEAIAEIKKEVRSDLI